MSMSSLFVVTNALRLRLFRPGAATVTSEENICNKKCRRKQKWKRLSR